MNFLVNYFKRSVEATGNQSYIDEMNAKISKWESRLEVDMEEGIKTASEEAMVEEVTVTVAPTTAPKKKLSKKERIALAEAKKLAETAKVIRKEAHKSLNELRGKVSETSTKEEKDDLAKLEAFVANLPNLNDVQLLAEVARLDAERQATTVVKF